MDERKIARVILTKEGSEPLYATKEFEYQETVNGILMIHRASRSLIPWHRVYEVEYVREEH